MMSVMFNLSLCFLRYNFITLRTVLGIRLCLHRGFVGFLDRQHIIYIQFPFLQIKQYNIPLYQAYLKKFIDLIHRKDIRPQKCKKKYLKKLTL